MIEDIQRAEQPERPTSFAADIPPEPTALRSFRDRDGDFWQLDTRRLRDGRSHRWECSRAKVPVGIGHGRNGDWAWILITYGPVRPVEWVEDLPSVSPPEPGSFAAALRGDVDSGGDA